MSHLIPSRTPRIESRGGFMMKSVFDEDHLYRTYFRLSVPVVLGMVVTLVYNLADTYFIARTGNTDLIAGVSLCAPVFTALMAFGNIFGQGGSSLASRMLGQQDGDGVRHVSSFCFFGALAAGAVLAVLMTLFQRPVLQMLGADEETMQYAFDYYIVLAIGAPIIVLSFIHSNLVRCEGMASESMIGTILGSVVNIILDPILISSLNMGSFGAAIATVIGYLCSILYFLCLLHGKNTSLSVRFSDAKVSRKDLSQILEIGITAALSNLMQSLCVIVTNQFLLPYGNDKVAAMGIVLKINMIVQLILVGFSFGGVPLFGYLYGAGSQKNLKKLVRFCVLFLCTLSLGLTAGIIMNAESLMHFFIQDAAMIENGAEMLRWQTVSAVFAAVVTLMTVLFQAAGKVIPALILSLSRQGAVYVIAMIVCVRLSGYRGVLMSQAAADLISAGIAILLLLVSHPLSMQEEQESGSRA